MLVNKRGSVPYDIPIVPLTHDEVLHRYKLNVAKKSLLPLDVDGYHNKLWAWEGHRYDGYGATHVWICSMCPMRSAEEVKLTFSRGRQHEQSFKEVCITYPYIRCVLANDVYVLAI